MRLPREQGLNGGVVTLNQASGGADLRFMFLRCNSQSTTSAYRRLKIRVLASKLVAGPQGPVIKIATGLRLFQEFPRIEDSVIRLEPDMTIHLPSQLCPRSLAHEPRSTISSCPDQGCWHGIHAIQQALSPIENPVGRECHPMAPLR